MGTLYPKIYVKYETMAGSTNYKQISMWNHNMYLISYIKKLHHDWISFLLIYVISQLFLQSENQSRLSVIYIFSRQYFPNITVEKKEASIRKTTQKEHYSHH